MGGQFVTFLNRFLNDRRGATATEYAIIAAGIAVVIVGAVGTLFDNLGVVFGGIGEASE